MPCQRVVGWYPAENSNIHREVNFPPAAALDEIRCYDVHLVAGTDRPAGSSSESIEYRASGSRADGRCPPSAAHVESRGYGYQIHQRNFKGEQGLVVYWGKRARRLLSHFAP